MHSKCFLLSKYMFGRKVVSMIAINISKSQAQEFATSIFDCIANYIEAHKAEYEAFLRYEEQNRGEEE